MRGHAITVGNLSLREGKRQSNLDNGYRIFCAVTTVRIGLHCFVEHR